MSVGPADRLDLPDIHDLEVGGLNLSAGKVLIRLIFLDFLCEGSRREDSHWGPASAGEVIC